MDCYFEMSYLIYSVWISEGKESNAMVNLRRQYDHSGDHLHVQPKKRRKKTGKHVVGCLHSTQIQATRKDTEPKMPQEKLNAKWNVAIYGKYQNTYYPSRTLARQPPIGNMQKVRQ
jgi:hypothetical protein